MSKPGRLWFPLDVGFWDDPDIIAVGETAAILFQRLVAYAKQHGTNGEVPMRTVRALGGRWWAKSFGRLVGRGLISTTDVGRTLDGQTGDSLTDERPTNVCQIVAYLSWNDSSNKIEERREKAAEKKRLQRAARANVPQGQPKDVPGHRVEVEKSISPSERIAAPAPSAPEAISTELLVKRAFASFYESAKATLWPYAQAKPTELSAICAWVESVSEREKLEPEAVVARLMQHFAADEYVRGLAHPWSHFRTNFANYWTPAKPKTSAPAPTGSIGRGRYVY